MWARVGRGRRGGTGEKSPRRFLVVERGESRAAAEQWRGGAAGRAPAALRNRLQILSLCLPLRWVRSRGDAGTAPRGGAPARGHRRAPSVRDATSPPGLQVDFPDSLTTIGSYAFSGCDALTQARGLPPSHLLAACVCVCETVSASLPTNRGCTAPSHRSEELHTGSGVAPPGRAALSPSDG